MSQAVRACRVIVLDRQATLECFLSSRRTTGIKLCPPETVQAQVGTGRIEFDRLLEFAGSFLGLAVLKQLPSVRRKGKRLVGFFCRHGKMRGRIP